MGYIHKEGYSTIIIVSIVLIGINFLCGYFLSLPYWLSLSLKIISVALFLIVLNFFRNPSRNTPINDKHVIAPADGTVVVIEEVDEPEFYKDERIQVSIFMSPLNVHVNRYPISGKISYMKYHPGQYLVAWHPKSSTLNERTTVVIEKENKFSLLVRQIAGVLARRIVYYPKENDVVKQGDQLGFIKFGSRVDTYLPLGTKINVKLNEKVVGGETVLAEIN